jgi:hypothetical protein
MTYRQPLPINPNQSLVTKGICTLCWLWTAVVLCLVLAANAYSKTVTLAWDWDPGRSGYTAGPNGDVAFAILICAEDDPDCTYGDRLTSDADNCWWNIDHYSCQASVTFAINPGIYFFVAIAHLTQSPSVTSPPSNQVEYVANYSLVVSSSGLGSGGGCFIGTALSVD